MFQNMCNNIELCNSEKENVYVSTIYEFFSSYIFDRMSKIDEEILVEKSD